MKHYKLLFPLLSSILMNACSSDNSSSENNSNSAIQLKYSSLTDAKNVGFGASVGIIPSNLTDTPDNGDDDLISHILNGNITLTQDRAFNELVINRTATLINQGELLLGVIRAKAGAGTTTVSIDNTGIINMRFLELDGGTTGSLKFNVKTTLKNFNVMNVDTVPDAPFSDSNTIIQIKGNVTWNLQDSENKDINVELEEGDILTVSNGCFTTPKLFNESGYIIIKDSPSSISTSMLFQQNASGALILLDDGSHARFETKIQGTKVNLDGTLQILASGDGFKLQDKYILVNASDNLYGTFDQVSLPFGAIYYTGNQVLFRHKIFAPIENWRTKIKLESTSKYQHNDFIYKDTLEPITVTRANRVDIMKTGPIDLKTLTNVGRMRVYGSITQNSQVTLNFGNNLMVQDLEIISPSNTLTVNYTGTLKFSTRGNLVPTFGFAKAEDAPVMLSNRGNTNWVQGLKIDENMIFAHKDGLFTVPYLTNNGTMVLDGPQAKIQVAGAFKHTGKIVVLHESTDLPDEHTPKITANSVEFNGTIEVISDVTSTSPYALIKSRQTITEDINPTLVVSTDRTLISYQPTITPTTSPMIGLQGARMDILSSAVSRQLAPISLSIAPNINLGLFAKMNEKNPKEMGTFEGSMRFGDFEMSAAHLALDLNMAKNTKVQALNIGAARTFTQNGINFTPSLKLGHYTVHSSGMNIDVGSLKANEMHFSQSILSLGGKLNFDKNSSWNSYVEAHYHHCLDSDSTTKVHLESRSAKWKIQGSNMLHLKAGIENHDQTLGVQGEFMQMGDLNYKVSFQVDFKQ